jgi:branched-subunit amino acid transport protein
MKKYWPLNLIAGSFLLVLAGVIYCDEFAQGRKEFTEVLFPIFVFSGAFMVGAVPVTVLLCRHKIRHNKQVSYLMVLLAACIATVLTMLSGCLVLDGSKVFTIGYWIGDWPIVRRWLIFWPWGFFVSALVAFGVVVYFKRQSKRDEMRTV